MTEQIITLRDYQTRAIEAARACETNPLLVLATGLGKTTVFCEIVREHVQGGGRALIIAHRKELLEQAMDRITLQTGLLASRGKGSSVIVESVQSLAGRIKRGKEVPKASLVILDEAHHAAAESYQIVFEHYKEARWIGVTATPDRQDALPLPFSPVFSYGIEDAIKDGWLVPIRYKLFQVNPPSTGKIRVQAGDFVLTDLASAVDNSNEKIVDVVTEEARGKRAIAFFPTVETAKYFSEIFAAHEFTTGLVHGGTPKAERESTIAAYRRGDIDILCNCAVLTEGFDAPETDLIIMARPTKSESLYRQCIGRGSRLSPGKKECTVIHFGFQFFGDFEVHPARIGAKDEMIEKDPLMSAAAASVHPFVESTGELLESLESFQLTYQVGEHQFNDAILNRTPKGFISIMGLHGAGSSIRQDALARRILPGFFANYMDADAHSCAIIEYDKRKRKQGMAKLSEAWFLWRWRLPPNIPRVVAMRWIAELKRTGLNNARRLEMIAELKRKVGVACSNQ